MPAYLNAVILLISLFFFVAIFYGPWQSLCIDWCREKLFEARDSLFDLAADGKLSFESRVYKELRLDMEMLIRFSHRVSWPRLVFYSLIYKKHGNGSETKPWPEQYDSISDLAVSRAVKKECVKAAYAVLGLLFFRSMLLLPLGLLFWATYRSRKSSEFMRASTRSIYFTVRQDAENFEKSIGWGRRAA